MDYECRARTNANPEYRSAVVGTDGRFKIKRCLKREGTKAVCELADGSEARIELRGLSIARDVDTRAMSDEDLVDFAQQVRRIKTVSAR